MDQICSGKLSIGCGRQYQIADVFFLHEELSVHIAARHILPVERLIRHAFQQQRNAIPGKHHRRWNDEILQNEGNVGERDQLAQIFVGLQNLRVHQLLPLLQVSSSEETHRNENSDGEN